MIVYYGSANTENDVFKTVQCPIRAFSNDNVRVPGERRTPPTFALCLNVITRNQRFLPYVSGGWRGWKGKLTPTDQTLLHARKTSTAKISTHDDDVLRCN